MVKFEFTVTDEEASAIMDCMNECRTRAFEIAAFGVHDGLTAEQAGWYKRHSQWLALIIRKMHNTRVTESEPARK